MVKRGTNHNFATLSKMIFTFVVATQITLTEASDVQEIIQPYFHVCACNYLAYFFGVMSAYKGLLLLFGTFLAWETRKVFCHNVLLKGRLHTRVGNQV